MTTSRVKNIES